MFILITFYFFCFWWKIPSNNQYFQLESLQLDASKQTSRFATVITQGYGEERDMKNEALHDNRCYCC